VTDTISWIGSDNKVEKRSFRQVGGNSILFPKMRDFRSFDSMLRDVSGHPTPTMIRGHFDLSAEVQRNGL
jgi:hypothetical protein